MCIRDSETFKKKETRLLGRSENIFTLSNCHISLLIFLRPGECDALKKKSFRLIAFKKRLFVHQKKLEENLHWSKLQSNFIYSWTCSILRSVYSSLSSARFNFSFWFEQAQNVLLVVVICYRVKLRHMLEWSSLYRVTLLLSKINDDSDLDAEAAILYGKVSNVVIVWLLLRRIIQCTVSNGTLFTEKLNLINIETLCHVCEVVSILLTKVFNPTCLPKCISTPPRGDTSRSLGETPPPLRKTEPDCSQHDSHSHKKFSWAFLSKGERCIRLTLCEATTRETRPDHNTGNFIPYSFL